jgi:very-short-patch-repair endonuclease
MFDHDVRLARWFADNDSIISVAEAGAIGVSAEAVKRRAARGLLVREQCGVYRDAAAPPTFRSSLRAAIAASGGRAFVSGPSLMRLYDARGTWSDHPEVVIVGEEHLELPGVHVRRIDRLDPRDVRPRLGLPALAPPLGLLLLGASEPPWKVETGVHDLVFQGHTARPQLVDVLCRYGGKGRWGTTSFRAAVESLDPKGRATQTNMELVSLRAIRDAGLPEPDLQLRIVDGDGRRRRADIAWPEQRLDLETDGDRWHLHPRDRRAMQVRDEALAAVGYTTIRADSAEVEHDLRGLIARLRPFFGS